MAIIELKSVSKHYDLGKVVVQALKDVSLQIEEGSFVTITGPSGSGKSTLLNLIGLIDTADKGEILLNEKSIDYRNDRRLTAIRREYMGFIFQSFNLIPILNVEENIMYPLQHTKFSIKERRERIYKLLERVGLGGMTRRMPNELSGGQRQRVAIARALVHSPKIVLADEPTANLDSVTSDSMIELMHELRKAEKATFILATHDQDVIDQSDILLNVIDGKLEERPA